MLPDLVINYRRIAEGATPVTAQAQELLAQANLESAVYTATEGAHGFSVISQVKRTDGARQNLSASPFLFLKDYHDTQTNSSECSTLRNGRQDGRFRRLGYAAALWFTT